MNIIKGNVTAPTGFKASGLWCGIKRSGKPDLSLIVSEKKAVTAGVFTKNSVKAAPVIVTKKALKNASAQAIVTNSGNANCFTGHFGHVYARKTAELFGRLLTIPRSDVLVASTGIIGKPLPLAKIEKAAKPLVDSLSKKGGLKAARAILTTDLRIKETAVCFFIGKKLIKMGAISKGSGMIAPNMATMLCYITTDVSITPSLLKKALEIAVDNSFHCITIDGCMSTNDMVVVMANGMANNLTIKKEGKDFNTFCRALKSVCLNQAKKIVKDAEGATKFITINVLGAKTASQARTIGLRVANSNLVKTAAYGNNPNWGRVAAAVGSLGLGISDAQLKITFSSFKFKQITINIECHLGNVRSTVYTSDLSLEYIRINGKYN